VPPSSGSVPISQVAEPQVPRSVAADSMELAIAHQQLILIHTPHLEDKYKGTHISVEVLRRYPAIDPRRVMVDHAEEHTIEMILDQGFWAGLTLYPQTKISPQRAADLIEKYGPERICVAGACDWGASDPIAVPRFAMEMRRRRHSEAIIQQIVFDNPVRFLGQSPKFKVPSSAPETAPARVG